MKNRIFNLLIWILNKWYSPQFEKCQCGTTVTVSLKHYIPNNKKWHYCALTTEYWLRVPKQGIAKEVLYIDGLRVKKVKSSDITYCINKECKKRKECQRNILHLGITDQYTSLADLYTEKNCEYFIK